MDTTTSFLIIIALLLLAIWRRLPNKQQPSSPTAITVTNPTDFRSLIADNIIQWALVAIGILGVLIIVGAGVNLWYATKVIPNNATAVEKAATTFFTSSQYVLGTILPVVATWVGTVLAFYFGKENFDAAARNSSALIQQLSSREKLQRKSAKEAMMKLSEITYYQLAQGEDVKTLKLKTLIESGFGKDKNKPRNRLPIISKEGLPLHVLHRSTLDGYVTAQLIESQPTGVEGDGQTEETDLTKTAVAFSELTLDMLVSSALYKDSMAKSFLTLKETQTLADAKDLLDDNKACLDVLVTENGTDQSKVIGWITNAMILAEATLS
ncbi:MAG: hypothetical protein NTX45_13695 [Proteobacteria bacterium]|nr:hypothetical protein [Pseudomonadota bacterium]